MERLGFILTIFCLLSSACSANQPQTRLLLTPTFTATLPPSNTPTPWPTFTPTPLATATPSSACPIPDLGWGQHISASGSYTETQTQAAGPIMCRIERDSCAYRHLIGNLDSSIVFKQEEEPPYDEEDIRMHPGMLLPLSKLNELVQAEWGGTYRLRITDAYDSLLEHDLGQRDKASRASLHFEGRAIDITTWPIDKTQYGRLCALAHCAGFAWVHHEGDHCHVALNASSVCLRCNQ